jgi:hypothetical protein
MVTCDKNLQYQQNLKNRKIALIVLGTNRWRVLSNYSIQIAIAVDSVSAGSYVFVPCLLPPKR